MLYDYSNIYTLTSNGSTILDIAQTSTDGKLLRVRDNHLKTVQRVGDELEFVSSRGDKTNLSLGVNNPPVKQTTEGIINFYANSYNTIGDPESAFNKTYELGDRIRINELDEVYEYVEFKTYANGLPTSPLIKVDRNGQIRYYETVFVSASECYLVYHIEGDSRRYVESEFIAPPSGSFSGDLYGTVGGLIYIGSKQSLIIEFYKGGNNNVGGLGMYDLNTQTLSVLVNYDFINVGNISGTDLDKLHRGSFDKIYHPSTDILYFATNGGGLNSRGVLSGYKFVNNTISKLVDFPDMGQLSNDPHSTGVAFDLTDLGYHYVLFVGNTMYVANSGLLDSTPSNFTAHSRQVNDLLYPVCGYRSDEQSSLIVLGYCSATGTGGGAAVYEAGDLFSLERELDYTKFGEKNVRGCFPLNNGSGSYNSIFITEDNSAYGYKESDFSLAILSGSTTQANFGGSYYSNAEKRFYHTLGPALGATNATFTRTGFQDTTTTLLGTIYYDHTSNATLPPNDGKYNLWVTGSNTHKRYLRVRDNHLKEVGRDGTNLNFLSTRGEPTQTSLRTTGFDVYNTNFFTGGSGDLTELLGGDPLTTLIIDNSAPTLSSDIYLPNGITALYDFNHGRLDFGNSGIPETGTITLDFAYVFNQDVDDSVLTISIDFTENNGNTFSKSVNVSFSDQGALVDIDQVTRITFFIGPTLTQGYADINIKCNEDASFILKTLTIYTTT